MGPAPRVLGAVLVVLAACTGPAVPTETAETDSDIDTDTATTRLTLDQRLASVLASVEPPVAPLDPLPRPDDALVDLGRLLFYDSILSGNKDVACATCHDPAHGTSDGLPLALGTGAEGRGPDRAGGDHPPWGARRSPPLWGRARLDALFWDGRVERTEDGVTSVAPVPDGASELDALATQALHPILDPGEMLGRPGDVAVDGRANELAAGTSAQGVYDALERRLASVDTYRTALEAIDPDWDMGTVVEALAEYQRERFDVTDSRWDRYLRGETSALSDGEKLGATFFFAEGRCVSCHAGPALSDGRFHNIGVRPIGEADPGRLSVSGAPDDRFAMRTPPLRNVGLVGGPYFHNGTVADLEGVVVHYADPELRRASTDHLPSDLVPSDDPDLNATLSADLPLAGSGTTTVGLSNIREFLGALSDEDAAARAIDDVPEAVPSGLPVGGWPN